MWASRQLHQGSELSCHLEDASGACQHLEWLAEGVGDGAGLHRLRELAPGG